MKNIRLFLILVVISSFCLRFALPATAQNLEIKTTPVQLGPNVTGILYEPVTPAAKSQIAVYVMHISMDYTHQPACAELSKRGYRVLCAANSIGTAPNKDGIDRKLLDVKLGMEYLRKYPGVKKIVLLGHSGGGMLMSTYQNIAENGLKACQGPEKIVKCSDSLAGLPPADGIMLLDAHWGDGISNLLFGMSPSMTGGELTPDLDPRNPRNGYDPAGSKYNDDFLRRYQTAVGKKMNQMVQDALAKYAAISADKSGSHNNDMFAIPGGNGVKLPSVDTHLLSHTHNAWPLLRPDGSIVTQVVYSVRPLAGQGQGQGGPGGPGGPGGQGQGQRGPDQGQGQGGPGNAQGPPREGAAGGGGQVYVREFLNTYAVRVTDDFAYGEDFVRGVDWSSSYANAPGNVKGIKVPLLTMGMTGSYEYLSAELNYQNSASTDKTIGFVEGASHGFNTCRQCEKTPGQYGDTQTTLYNYLDMWLGKGGRF